MTICIDNTPVEDHTRQFGLFVKREDLCCPPGPHFSKTRGVYPHIAKRPETLIGVLDTSHSQGGWAVAQACKALGKQCVNFYPHYKHGTTDLKPQQQKAHQLGAYMFTLPAGRSAVLYHQAKKQTTENGGYMMPNALKLPETVSETAAELRRTRDRHKDLPPVMLISASSGTIAAGLASVWRGTLIVHMGYSRPETSVRKYIAEMAGTVTCEIVVVDEGYAYKDVAKAGAAPPWPCNAHYDKKAFRWWMAEGREKYQSAIMWNVG